MDSQVYEKISSIIRELKGEFFERDAIIEAAWCAVLARQHMLLLGVPGTAKSMITTAVCGRIDDATYFERLLTRFSTPEDVFGPVSLKGLENDEYRRIIARMLPEAHIVFMDEIFKANASILNSFLTAINERAYDHGSTRISIPLITMFGASNELPEEEELDALYDRFILRFDVRYIQEAKNWVALMQSAVTPTIIGGQTSITLAELDQAQNEVKNTVVTKDIFHKMRDIKMALETDGIVASDRRWKQTVRVLQAKAWLDNRDEVGESDLEMLCEMLWKEPEQRKTLVSKILSVTNPLDLEAIKLYDDCQEVFHTFNPNGDSATKEEIAQKLRTALNKIDDTLKIADPAKTKKLKESQSAIKEWYRDVVKALDI